MIKIVRSVFIFVLVTVLASCEYWNKDTLGYLEYWSSTVQMGRVEVTDVTITKNDSGADTIPTSSTPTITGYIINPQSYPLVSTIGDLTSKNSAVRLTESVKGNAQIVGQDPTMLRIKLNPSDSSLEHTDFRVDFEAIRQETMQSAGEVMGVTLRYNTPPIAPTPIIKTESGEYKQPATGQVWEAYRDGNLYWAYDDSIKDEKDPNCAKWFTINGTRHLVAECKVPNEQVAGLSIFQFKTDYSNITVAAVDSEGVTGAAIVSGQVAPASITYNGNGNSYGDAPAPQSFERGTPVTIANQGNLRRSGYSFGGWNTNQYGTGDSYIAGSSYVFTENTTLYAVWNPMTEFFVSSSSTNDPSNDGSQQYPFGTVDKAVFYINEINDGTQNFIINVSGNCVAEEIAGNNSVVNIEPGQKLTLTIQGKDGQTATINANNHGRVMYVGGKANVTLKNIELIGGVVNGFGGGVYIAGGTLTMETGSSIENNTASNQGGGVYIAGGTFTMETGSSIKNNTANDQGGGVFINNGEFNMTGGTINGNTVTNGNGGGVFVKDTASTFNMSGGTISGNTATQGGGVYSTGILNMSGGTISGNTATQGGGVYIASGGSLTLNSGAIISGNTATDGKGVYNDGTFNISGSAIVNTNNDVYLPSGKTITVDSALTGSFPVATITPQTYTSNIQVLDGSRVDKEFVLFKVTEDSFGEKWGVAATGMLLQYTSAVNATDVLQNLVNGKSVSFDMTSDTQFTPHDSYTNGGNYSYGGKDYAIHVPKNTTLVINGNDKVLKDNDYCGSLLNVEGTLVLNDVRITDTNFHASVIEVLDGAMVILNNCIIENNIGGGGTILGVIDIESGGTAIMNGGKIEGNRLAGVTIDDGGEFTIKGGVIQNNQKGGVRCRSNATFVNNGGFVDKLEENLNRW